MIYRMNLPGCFRILTILLILSEENGPIFPQRPSPGLRPPSPAPASEGHRSRNGFRVFCVFRGSESLEVKVVASDAEVFDDVSDDAAGHVARMPCKRDETVGAERIRVMSMTPGGAKEFAADLTQTTVKLTAVPGGIFTHRSGGEDEFVAEGGRDGAAGFEQCFQMHLGGLLKSKGGLATVAPVRVATGQQGGFGNPDAVFILSELHFRKWNNHNTHMLTRFGLDVKEDGSAGGGLKTLTG